MSREVRWYTLDVLTSQKLFIFRNGCFRVMDVVSDAKTSAPPALDPDSGLTFLRLCLGRSLSSKSKVAFQQCVPLLPFFHMHLTAFHTSLERCLVLVYWTRVSCDGIRRLLPLTEKSFESMAIVRSVVFTKAALSSRYLITLARLNPQPALR